VAVTAASSGQITPPQGGAYAWTVVSNASPWTMTLSTAQGSKTLLPYTSDICVPTSSGMSFVMSVPPGGTSAAPATAVACYQVDWFLAGGSPPPGTFPVSLTAAALSSVTVGGISSEVVAIIGAGYQPFTAYQLPSWAVSIQLSWGSGSSFANLSVQGNNTGQLYVNPAYNFPYTNGGGAGNPPFEFDLLGPDTALTIAHNSTTGPGTLTVTAYAQKTGVNPAANPLTVQVTDPVPQVPFSAVTGLANNDTVVLLVGPGPQSYWEIANLNIFSEAGAANPAYLKGSTTGVTLLSVFGGNANAWGGSMFLAEGISLTGSGAGNVVGSAWYRLVTNISYSQPS
jgi:hypothetical protein